MRYRWVQGHLVPENQLSEEGEAMLMNFEGFVPHVYVDVAGYETIGYGHKLTEQEKASGVFASGITKDEGRALLKKDHAYAERAVNTLVKVPLSQNQFDALVSFVFNLGMASLMHSNLLVRLNGGDYEGVPEEMARWCKRLDPTTKQLVPDAGLLKRRQAEGHVWISGYGGKAADEALRVAAAQAQAVQFTTQQLIDGVPDPDESA